MIQDEEKVWGLKFYTLIRQAHGLMRQGRTITWMSNSRYRVAFARRLLGGMFTEDELEVRSIHLLQAKTGASIKFLHAHMTGCSGLHTQVLIMDSPSEWDPEVFRESRFIPAKSNDFGPLAIAVEL